MNEKQWNDYVKNDKLKQLVWKLDREIWAKVEAHEATTSWGREQSAYLIQQYADEQSLEFFRWYSECMNDHELRQEIEPLVIEECEYWQAKLKDLEKKLQLAKDARCACELDLDDACDKLKERDELIEEMSHGLTVATKLAEKHLAIGTKEMFQYLLTRYSNLKAK